MKLRLTSLAAALAAAPGCTALTDFDAQCVADSDCEALGRSLVCERGTCALPDLVLPTVTKGLAEGSFGCYEIFGGADVSSGVLTLGTLLPLTGGLADEGPPMEDGVRLAVDEINQAGGIDGRLLRVLACDSGTHPDVAERAAQHLVDVARVPAIIGPGSSTEVIETFRRVTSTAGAVLISPSATSPAISTLDDDGLVWRTVPSDALQGDVMAGWLLHRGYERVFVVNRDDAYGNGLASVVRSRFCLTRPCADTFRSMTYPTDDLSDAQKAAQQTIYAELQAFDPDVVVLIGYAPDGLAFLNLASGSGLPFILSEGLRAESLVRGIRDRADPSRVVVPGVSDTTLLCDLVGTYPSYPRGTAWQSFADRYRERTGAEPGTYSVHAYDATYALALAVAAAAGAGVRNPDGRHLAEGLARLSRGEPVSASGADGGFGAGVRKLTFDALATVDFTGLSGPLDFDRNGEAASSMEMWNLDPATGLDGGSIVPLGTVWDGVSVDSDGVAVYDFGGIPERNASSACEAGQR